MQVDKKLKANNFLKNVLSDQYSRLVGREKFITVCEIDASEETLS